MTIKAVMKMLTYFSCVNDFGENYLYC